MMIRHESFGQCLYPVATSTGELQQSQICLLGCSAILEIEMYLVIRCPGCSTFTYVDRYQRWKLCHNCGEAINVARAPTYLEVQNYSEADSIVKELERYLHKTGKRDLTETEKDRLHAEYARWLRKRL